MEVTENARQQVGVTKQQGAARCIEITEGVEVHALKACYEMCVFVVPPQSLPLFLRPPCRLGQARARRMHRCPVRHRIQWTHLRAQCGHRELMLSQPLLTGGHCSSGRLDLSLCIFCRCSDERAEEPGIIYIYKCTYYICTY